MKKIHLSTLFTFALLVQSISAQVTLDADGPDGVPTYELITSVLAPGHNPIEAPDCSYPEFGEHIREQYDDELEDNAFAFYIFVDENNDRCRNFDRQRNEIKTYDKSPDNLLGIEGEIVQYKWKFKLAEGFQSSPNFTHIHQLKSVGGSLASMPMYTLTTRKGTPDRLELRYAETDSQVTLQRTDLEPFIGTWLEVTETITYGTEGTYSIDINRISDGTSLFSYSDDSIINWRPDAEFVRPKWGIYRSLDNAQDLRDEIVLFNNFSIEELEVLSYNESVILEAFEIISNPAQDVLTLRNLTTKAELVQLYSLDGKKLIEQTINAANLQMDISDVPNGTYILNVVGKAVNQSELVMVLK